MSHSSTWVRRGTLALASATCALCCAAVLCTRPALASTTDELQAKVDAAAKTYDEATQKVDALQQKIDEAQGKIDEVQAQLPEQRERAREAVRTMYKMQQNTPGLISLLLTSSDFSDFLTTYHYIDAVQAQNVDDTQKLAQMESSLVSAQQTLSAAKTEATRQQQVAEQAMTEAQQALDDLNRQIAEQKAAEEAARAAAEAAEQKAAEEAAQEAAEKAAQEQAQTGSTTGTDASQSATTSNPSATDGSEVMTDGEWMFGSASAYSVADNTGGNTTASGEQLTDDSLTVAVPTSQRYLLGRSVQIRYNGKTVTARVTDTGGFAAYGRALDLAGGVWKAFGFTSPTAWGVRTVQYRFL